MIALGFHQSAVMIPIWLVLLLAMREDFALRPTMARVARKLRDPWFLCMLLVAMSFAVYVAFFRESRYHHVMVRSMPASGARALFSLAPEFLRQLCVEGLRGHLGAWGYALGGVATLVLCTSLLLLLWRGTALARFLVLAIGIEFSLPIVSTGFSQRYAYVVAALAAILLALWLWSPGYRRWKLATLLLLCCAWTYDQFTDLAEFRAAGIQSTQLVEQLMEAGPRGAPDAPTETREETRDTHRSPQAFAVDLLAYGSLAVGGRPAIRRIPWLDLAAHVCRLDPVWTAAIERRLPE